MSTQQFAVQLGSPVTVVAGDNTDFVAVAGQTGTVTLDVSVDGVNFFGGQTTGTGGAVSLNTRTLGLGAFAKVRCTAAVAAGALFACDIAAPFRGGANATSGQGIIAQTGVSIGTPNATTATNLWTMRFPAGYFRPNFSLEIDAAFSSTNSATVKTLIIAFGNTGVPTTAATQVLTSSAGGRLSARLWGKNDGASVGVASIGAALGYGINVAAPVSISTLANYLAQEQELLITSTKATGTDTVAMDSLIVKLYQ